MPANIIKSFSKKSGKSEEEVESLWQKAKSIAKEANREEDYAYIVGILKNMLSINESISFKEFIEL